MCTVGLFFFGRGDVFFYMRVMVPISEYVMMRFGQTGNWQHPALFVSSSIAVCQVIKHRLRRQLENPGAWASANMETFCSFHQGVRDNVSADKAIHFPHRHTTSSPAPSPSRPLPPTPCPRPALSHLLPAPAPPTHHTHTHPPHAP